MAVNLTKCEKKVARKIAEGKSSQEVADELCVSKRTVDFHLSRAYKKHGVNNRIGLIIALGLVKI